ncbi:MAG: ABC transporter permease subunit [Rhodospirillaceae bacterium]
MTAMAPKGTVWPWWRRALVVLQKEMLDHLRDRRSLWLALAYPLLGPLVVGMLLQLSASSLRVAPGSHAITVAASGMSYAPGLAQYLSRNRVILSAPIEGGLAGKVNRDALVLEVPLEAVTQPHFTVRLLYDANNVVSAGNAGVVADLIYDYGREQARNRLIERGLDPALLQPVEVERVHVGRRFNMGMLFYNLVPPLVVFMIFLGAVYIALDTTIGERERGTLEPLLTAPLRRRDLLAGKAGAAFLFTLATVVINLAAFRLVLGLLAAGVPGIDQPPSTATFLLIFLMALPIMVLAVTLQLAVAGLARSMKEAQIYLGLLPLVPALPGVASALSPMMPQLWTAGIPVFGQMVMFTRLISGAPVEPLHALLSAAVTLAVASLVFWWSTRLYERESMIAAE